MSGRAVLDFTVVEVCEAAVFDEDATALPKSEHVTFQRGAGGKVQEKFKFGIAHVLLSESEHGIGTRKHKVSNVPAGRWKKGPEGSKGEHYIGCNIFRDGAIVEVCLAFDSNTSALQKEKQARVTFQRGAGRRAQKVKKASTT